MKKILLLSVVIAFTACSTNQPNSAKQNNLNLKYPKTKKGDVVYSHFGTEVKDPYRWLEDDLSPDTETWVEAQNEVTFDYLDKIPFRDQIKEEMTTLWNYERVSAPFKEGDYNYFYKNDGLQQHAVLYRETDLDDKDPEVFLNPNKFSKDGTTSLSGIAFTKDGSRAVYQISEGGSDWRKLIVIDTNSKKQIEDTLKDVKFSGLSWKGNEGFFYSSYDKPTGVSELSAKTSEHKLFYHKVGTPQSTDELIFGGSDTPRRYIGGYVTEDEKFLVISASVSTTGNELYIKDLSDPNAKIINILDNFDTTSNIVDTRGDDLFILTNKDAPNNRLVKVNFKNPKPQFWEEFIPEKEEVLSISTGGGFLFAHYLKDASDKIYQYNYSGKQIREINLPGLGSANGLSGKKDEKTLYYGFTNYVTPYTIYNYDVISGETNLYKKPDIQFNPDDYISKQVFYPSSDGKKIPMMITYKKGTQLNGKNPTILYGYGGFNISLTPSFSTTNAVWLNHGGIYAVANLRGGGEYGKKWHDAGRQLKKKTVFNDFIAAAEYLQKEGYTSKEYTALMGGSNGGLLVGAVETMRPDLFQVALPAVGVLDMLRYHTFTAGAGWAYDYGTAEDNKEMFDYLKSYSPVHNVKPKTCYPSTLVTTGDHDDRVVPAHSYKFAAELQDKQACKKPTLIRIETKAGHGAGKPTELIIQESTDKLSFALYEMGIRSLD